MTIPYTINYHDNNDSSHDVVQNIDEFINIIKNIFESDLLLHVLPHGREFKSFENFCEIVGYGSLPY